MEYRFLFPLGKAYGQAFCNRIEETKILVGHIQSGKHSLLIAPRRYGKSSLAEKAIKQANIPHIKINFHLCTTEKEVADIILNNVIKLIGLSINQVEKLIQSIKKYAANFEPLLSFGNDRAHLRLEPKRNINSAVIISDALLLLEKLLREKNRRVVIFFDEFQEISRIKNNTAIEGAIRTAAQEMNCVSIIFSGSIRSLLLHMFENEARPLYKLCRKIKLKRISKEDYEKHIQRIAKKTWGEQLEPTVLNSIVRFTNRHPYYVNYLCDCIWSQQTRLPNKCDIEKAWQQVVKEEWGDAIRELSDLAMGQRRLLRFIALGNSKNIMSRECSEQLHMSISSINSAVTALLNKDYLEKHEHGKYEVINPLLLAVLQGAYE